MAWHPPNPIPSKLQPQPRPQLQPQPQPRGYVLYRIGTTNRWHNHLNPDVRKDAWKPEEDLIIFQYHRSLGNQWAEIAKLLPGRYTYYIHTYMNDACLLYCNSGAAAFSACFFSFFLSRHRYQTAYQTAVWFLFGVWFSSPFQLFFFFSGRRKDHYCCLFLFVWCGKWWCRKIR